MAGSVVGRGCRNEFRGGVGDSKGVLEGRDRSKSEFKEKAVDYQIQGSLFFPRSIPLTDPATEVSQIKSRIVFSARHLGVKSIIHAMPRDVSIGGKT